MKKLLADFLNIGKEDIQSYHFDGGYNLSIGSEHDYGRTYNIIEGVIYQPQYIVITVKDEYKVNLEELLVFIYNKT
jgi:hypothetical protein